MRCRVLVRLIGWLVVLLGVAVALLAQIGDGGMITAMASIHELHSGEITAERQGELLSGLDRLTAALQWILSVILYCAIAVVFLATVLLFLKVPHEGKPGS